MPPQKRGLGRGLSALIGDLHIRDTDTTQKPPLPPHNYEIQMLGVDMICAGRYQPRQYFSEEHLEELSKSLKEKGILQPLLVRPISDSDIHHYEIVAGERRWRAAQKAQIHEIPVIIRHFSDREALEVGLIENIQRTDLNIIEEVEAYHKLIQAFSYTQEQLAQTLGKSRSHIANILRLIGVTPKIRMLLIENKISPGHARALLAYDDADKLIDRILRERLSVRTVEKLVAQNKHPRLTQKNSPQPIDVNRQALENSLAEKLGLSVKISIGNKTDQGEIRIRYKYLEQLDRIIEKLMAS